MRCQIYSVAVKVIRVLLGSLVLSCGLFAQEKIKVPKNSTAPVIDAWLDGVWLNVPANRMLKAMYDTPFGWADITGSFRLMWDEDNLSVYVQVVDETIRYDAPQSYNDDTIEIYFDRLH